MRPSEKQVELLGQYLAALIASAEILADAMEAEGSVKVETVAIIVMTEGGWGGQQVAAPSDWGRREEALFLVAAAQAAVEELGGSLTVQGGPERVRPMPRRSHRRRR